jgi:hypothetical protein
MENIISAINGNSVVTLRAVLRGTEVTTELATAAIKQVVESQRPNQYTKKTMIAELLFCSIDERIHRESARSSYPQVLEESLRSSSSSEGFKTELKALGQKIRRLKEMLESNRYGDFEPNRKDSTGNTPLHYACELGLNALVVSLMNIGARFDQENRQNETSIEIAAKKGRKALIQAMLLKAPTCINWSDPWVERFDELVDREWHHSIFQVELNTAGRPLPEGFVWDVVRNRRVEIENAVQVGTLWTHKSNVERCACCSKPSLYRFEHGVCDECADADRELVCSITGDKTPFSMLRWNDHYRLFHKSELSIDNKVRGYHQRPNFSFKTINTNTKRYYGFELELVVPSNREYVLSSMAIDMCAGDELYMNTDGSIGGFSDGDQHWEIGYELISHPMSLEYAQQSQKLKSAFSALGRYKAASMGNRTTGLHVHVSREGFDSDRALQRTHLFIYSEAHRAYIEEMAGRSAHDTSYTSFRRRDTVQGITYRGGDRYQAINYLNEKTVEFRLFKGGVGLEYVLEKIEFLDALIEFCSLETHDADGINVFARRNNVDAFETWIMSNHYTQGRGKAAVKTYRWPNLARFTKNRKSSQKTLPFMYCA